MYIPYRTAVGNYRYITIHLQYGAGVLRFLIYQLSFCTLHILFISTIVKGGHSLLVSRFEGPLAVMGSIRRCWTSFSSCALQCERGSLPICCLRHNTLLASRGNLVGHFHPTKGNLHGRVFIYLNLEFALVNLLGLQVGSDCVNTGLKICTRWLSNSLKYIVPGLFSFIFFPKI